MAKTVVGLFDTSTEAQSVIQDLVNSGFQRNNIGLLANNAKGEHNIGTANNSATNTDSGATDTGESKAGDDAGAGAVGGTVVGGALGLLVGIGALAIPGIGPVVAAGTLATVLGSTALGAGIGAGIGGIIGALVGMGVPKEDAEYYNEGVRRGGTLVTVKADDNEAQRAYDVMQRHGAVDIDERGAEWKQTGYQGYDPNAQPYTATQIDQFRPGTGTVGQTATGAAQGAVGRTEGAIAGAAQGVKNAVQGTAQNAGNAAQRGANDVMTVGGNAGNKGQRGVYTVDSDQMIDNSNRSNTAQQ